MAGILPIDTHFLQEELIKLLQIHSPTGYTDPIVRTVCETLEGLGVEYELTRRGAVRANLKGKRSNPDRAVVAHLDTVGGMVRELKPNGRLALIPVGTWSSRFAEGARVTVFSDDRMVRGTVLPLMASGHVYNEKVDTQPVGWDYVEVRLDEPHASVRDLEMAGFNVGDFVGFDSHPEISPNGYINARHLDDKAGVAALLAFVKAVKESSAELPVTFHVLFTISEETGSGASAVLHGDVAEMVTIDNGTSAPGQNSREQGITIAMADSTGPFDFHLTHRLLRLCREHGLPHQRDVFRFYRSDSASAVEAGNDIRTGLITFGVDASHGYERTHLASLKSIAELLSVYAQTAPLFHREAEPLSTLEGFPSTRTVEMPRTDTPALEVDCLPTQGREAADRGPRGEAELRPAAEGKAGAVREQEVRQPSGGEGRGSGPEVS